MPRVLLVASDLYAWLVKNSPYIIGGIAVGGALGLLLVLQRLSQITELLQLIEQRLRPPPPPH